MRHRSVMSHTQLMMETRLMPQRWARLSRHFRPVLHLKITGWEGFFCISMSFLACIAGYAPGHLLTYFWNILPGGGSPALMWYASSATPSGTVSPRWIMSRIACTSGVRNSCALGLNSSFAHLQQRRPL